MPHRWLALDDPARGGKATLLTDFAALPFAANSLDLVVLPHALELSPDPHATLREVERVLVPEGRVVISGFNPGSLWGLRQGRARLCERMGVTALGASNLFLPEAGDFIGPWRLRDWLRLLSFELESDRYGCYRPAMKTDKWLQRSAWMDRAGARWWPIFGAVYFVVAVKRVRGMRLLDAGCGTGALALQAALRGAEVVAIDLSPTLVKLAAERMAAEHPKMPGWVEFLSGDMLSPDLGHFDHVVCMDSLIHYDSDQIAEALAGLAQRTRGSMVFTFA
eukprot:gene26909-48362_t